MELTTPWALLALVAVPLGLACYAARARRERAATRAFAAPPVAPSALPRRAGWRRHAPVGLVGLALTALLVSLARPTAVVAVPAEQASIVLATDVSGSMQATDVAPSRLRAAKAAALEFAGRVPRRVKIGVLAFNQTPSVLQAPTADRAAVRAAIGRQEVSGGTATGDALAAALRLVRPAGAGRAPAAIVLLGDGASTRGRDAVAVAGQARRLGVPVFTVSLGTAQGTIRVTGPHGATRTEQVPPDPQTLERVAQTSGGQAFRTADAERLRAVYERLGSQLGTTEEERELTSGFAGAALVLVLLGSALSLRWTGRLV